MNRYSKGVFSILTLAALTGLIPSKASAVFIRVKSTNTWAKVGATFIIPAHARVEGTDTACTVPTMRVYTKDGKKTIRIDKSPALQTLPFYDSYRFTTPYGASGSSRVCVGHTADMTFKITYGQGKCVKDGSTTYNLFAADVISINGPIPYDCPE